MKTLRRKLLKGTRCETHSTIRFHTQRNCHRFRFQFAVRGMPMKSYQVDQDMPGLIKRPIKRSCRRRQSGEISKILAGSRGHIYPMIDAYGWPLIPICYLPICMPRGLFGNRQETESRGDVHGQQLRGRLPIADTKSDPLIKASRRNSATRSNRVHDRRKNRFEKKEKTREAARSRSQTLFKSRGFIDRI